jgi:adenylyltransferase/sulfurtransferase
MLTDQERDRYRRQILLFGEEGQEKLREAEIFIAGAGGLGCPVSLYLAAAGVGTLTIVDRDVVEISNLNRQILHYSRDLGKRKTISAEEKLRQMNPDVTIQVLDTTIDASNVRELVGNANGIVDAMDNFPIRYLLNKIAIEERIPFFHGAVRGMDGQVTTILPPETACLRCIFPHPPPPEIFPVVGVTPGIIGMIQANEVLKFLIGKGELLTNRLLLWEGSRSRLEEIVVQRNPLCDECGMADDGEGSK